LQNLDAIAATFGIIAPPVFVTLVVVILGAQLLLFARRRRHTRYLVRLVEEHRERQRRTAEQLERLMEEYEQELAAVGDPCRNGALDEAYARYRRRQESAIHHLQILTDLVATERREETPAETVAHQFLDWFANQQAVR
jgi:hypothetical protein